MVLHRFAFDHFVRVVPAKRKWIIAVGAFVLDRGDVWESSHICVAWGQFGSRLFKPTISRSANQSSSRHADPSQTLSSVELVEYLVQRRKIEYLRSGSRQDFRPPPGMAESLLLVTTLRVVAHAFAAPRPNNLCDCNRYEFASCQDFGRRATELTFPRGAWEGGSL